VKYMLLIYGDERALDETARQACYVESTELAHQLERAGQFVATAPLHPTAMATSVRVREGKRLVTDGPFAETRSSWGASFSSKPRIWTKRSRWPRASPWRVSAPWRCGR